MPRSRGRREKTKRRGASPARSGAARPPALPPASTQVWGRCFRSAKWAVGAVVAVIGLAASVDGIWGSPWPRDPEVHPHDTIDGSSLVLPFTVKNRSGFFDMANTTFRCGVDLIYAEDSVGQRVVIRDAAFVSGVYSVPADKA